MCTVLSVQSVYLSNFNSTAVVACNRPFNFDTIPISLLQKEFGLFLLQALTVAACEWHENRTQRRSAFQEVPNNVAQLYLSAETIPGTEYTTDGNLKANIMPAVIRACKNETGCALPEVIAYYVQFLVKVLDRRDRCTRILLVDIGTVVHCITTQHLMI